jgi:hypothetical protein
VLLREHQWRVREGPSRKLTSLSIVPIDEGQFESLLEQVRELHRRTDEITRSKSRVHDHVRARLSWSDPPNIPPRQRELADQVVDVLGKPRLSTAQSKRLWREYFGK